VLLQDVDAHASHTRLATDPKLMRKLRIMEPGALATDMSNKGLAYHALALRRPPCVGLLDSLAWRGGDGLQVRVQFRFGDNGKRIGNIPSSLQPVPKIPLLKAVFDELLGKLVEEVSCVAEAGISMATTIH
jgi:hypothetical protein